MVIKSSGRGLNLQKWHSYDQNLEISISQETYDGGSAVYPKERIGATNKDLIVSNFKAFSDKAKATERRIEVVLMTVHV